MRIIPTLVDEITHRETIKDQSMMDSTRFGLAWWVIPRFHVERNEWLNIAITNNSRYPSPPRGPCLGPINQSVDGGWTNNESLTRDCSREEWDEIIHPPLAGKLSRINQTISQQVNQPTSPPISQSMSDILWTSIDGGGFGLAWWMIPRLYIELTNNESLTLECPLREEWEVAITHFHNERG